MRKLVFSLLLALTLALQPQEKANAFPLGGAPSGIAACSYTPPLDANPAAAAYSYRVLSSAWIGQNIVTIQRSSDSTQKTFTASAPSCTINTSDAFFDGSTYTVVTMYDQSGHGADVTQATNANRPTLTLNCQNSHPCGVYNGTSQHLTATLASGISADTFAAVASVSNLSSSRYVVSLGSSANNTSMAYSTTASACASIRTISSVSTRGSESCTAGAWYRWIATQNNNLDSIYLNGTIGTDDTTARTLVSSTTLDVGALSGGNFMIGSIAELIIFAPDLSITNSNTVSSNQGSYWGL